MKKYFLLLIILSSLLGCASGGPENHEIDSALFMFAKKNNLKENTNVFFNEIKPIFKSKKEQDDYIIIEAKVVGKKLVQLGFLKVNRNNRRSWLGFSKKITFKLYKNASRIWTAEPLNL